MFDKLGPLGPGILLAIGIILDCTPNRKFSRVNLNVSVGYGENLDKVIETTNRICQEMAV
jgi:small-conductance mechanosensitive channel